MGNILSCFNGANKAPLAQGLEDGAQYARSPPPAQGQAAAGAPEHQQVIIKVPQPPPDAIAPAADPVVAPATERPTGVLSVAGGQRDWPDPDAAPADVKISGKPLDLRTDGPPMPPNDPQRREVGIALGLHKASKCVELDFVLETLCKLFQAPYASLALYYNKCCWLANTHNHPAGPMPWPASACPWNTMVKQPQCIVCGDLLEDARFAHTDWVHAGLRVYCSAPLLASNGHRLGTICFMDTVARKVDAGMCRVLNNFGEIAVRVLERHLGLAERLRLVHQLVPPQLNTLVAAAHGDSAVAAPVQPQSAEQYWTPGGSLDMEVSPSSCVLASGGGAASGQQPGEAPRVRGGKQRELLPADLLLASVMKRQLRKTEALQDACVLVVDTAIQGWPILYADETWKVWTGVPRAEVVGQGLRSVLAVRAPGLAPLNWDALQEEADGAERFIIPGIMVVPRQQQEQQQEVHALVPRRPDNNAAQSMMVQDMDMRPRHTPAHEMSPDLPASPHLPTSTESLLEKVTSLEQQQLMADAQVDNRVDIQCLLGDVSMMAADTAAQSSSAHVQPNPSLVQAGAHCSSTWNSLGRAVDMSFRPMALDVLDSDALPLGIPSWVPFEACEPVRRLYAVRVHESTTLPAPSQPLAPMIKLPHRKGGALNELSTHLFPGLHIGQVLGRGGYGTAYQGTWHDVNVVVKVQDHNLDNIDALRLAQIEIALGQMVRHPHLVRTLAHGAAELPAAHDVNTPGKQAGRGGGAAGDGTGLVRGLAAPHTAAAAAAACKEVAPPFLLSGEGHMSCWLKGMHDSWDDMELNAWFSHCDSGDLIKRDPVSSSSQLSSSLPGPQLLINGCSIASDITHYMRLPSILEDQDAAASERTSAATSSNPVTSVQAASLHTASLAAQSHGPSMSGQDSAAGAQTLAGNPGAFSQQQQLTRLQDMHLTTPGWKCISEETACTDAIPAAGDAAAAGDDDEDDAGRDVLLGMLAQAKALGASGHSVLGASSHTQSSVGTGRPTASGVGQGEAWAVGGSANVSVEGEAASGAHTQQPASTVTSSTSTTSSFTPSKVTYVPVGLDAISCLAPPAPPAPPAGPVHPLPPAPAGMWSGSTGDSGASTMKHEVAVLLESAQQHESKMHHTPLSFPLQLRTFAILEFCDGGTLQDAIDRGWVRRGPCILTSPPDLHKVLTLGLHISRGVGYLHSRGVVHADLSSANILLCSEHPRVEGGGTAALQQAAEGVPLPPPAGSAGAGAGEFTQPVRQYMLAPNKTRKGEEMHFIAKVADFGKACLLGPEGVSQAGGYATLTHMAPEVLIQNLLTTAADVYAFGVLLWQMYTGSRPWPNLSHRMLITCLVEGAAELQWEPLTFAIPEAQQQAAQAVVQLGKSCLSRSPEARPTMQQVELQLSAMLRQLEAAA